MELRARCASPAREEQLQGLLGGGPETVSLIEARRGLVLGIHEQSGAAYGLCRHARTAYLAAVSIGAETSSLPCPVVPALPCFSADFLGAGGTMEASGRLGPRLRVARQ